MTASPAALRADALLARVEQLYPRVIDLSLDRVRRLLADLGEPQAAMPPAIHVAGTNGKGSTCAFLRAIAEAAGLRTHVHVSPHLVRLTERFVLAGREVEDAVLAEALEEVERVNAGRPITVFEVLAATACLLFAGHPADLAIVEVGLGGRLDATNVIDRPLAAAVTSISLDHQDFLGSEIGGIAREKAGIFKPGRPAVTGQQPTEALAVLRQTAAAAGAPFLARGETWQIDWAETGMRYEDADGTLALPAPGLLGAHQLDNAGIAIAALRASGLRLDNAAYAGVAAARWPARLQRLQGRLARTLPSDFELWLDGGHNEGAGVALAEQARRWADRPLHLLIGMKRSKDARAFLAPLLPLARSVRAIREPGQHAALEIEEIVEASGGVALPAGRVTEALRGVAAAEPAGRVLICGSLYLAGEVLRLDVGAAA